MFSDAVERSIETDGAEIVRQHGRLELHMSRVEANGREMMCAQGYVLLCLCIYNNNNNNDRLTAFDPGQPG